MSKSKWYQWLIAVLIALVVRFGIGPLMLGIQLLAGGSTLGGNCGNSQFRMPNTDLFSWWLIDRDAGAFEQACVVHDQCYNKLGLRKMTCDRVFLHDMKNGCYHAYQDLDSPDWLARVGELGCTYQAETYFLGVLTMPPVHYAYCIEQYYARVGTRDVSPNPFQVVLYCGQSE